MTWRWDIFGSGSHGGWLVDDGFFCTVLVWLVYDTRFLGASDCNVS